MDKRIVGLLAALALLAAVGCGDADDGVPRISVQELQAALAADTAVAVDVRGRDVYDASHIKGALHLALHDVPDYGPDLPQGKKIVTYCS